MQEISQNKHVEGGAGSHDVQIGDRGIRAFS